MKNSLTALATGAAVGIFTLIGQGYLPMEWNFLANSGAIWLIPAFLLALRRRGSAPASVLTAILCLLGSVYGYYGLEAVMNRHPFAFGKWVLVWTVAAVVGGLVFGMGAFLARGGNSLLRNCGANLLPAVFLAEGLDELLHLADYRHMIFAVYMKLLIGLLLYAVIQGRRALQWRPLLSFAGLTALGLLGFAVLLLSASL